MKKSIFTFNRFKAMLCIMVLCMGSTSHAQVAIDMRLDTMLLLVGQQTHLTLDVSCDKGAKVRFPDLKKGDMIVPSIEVLDKLKQDTILLNEGKRMQILQKYVITSFDSALYYLPPCKVEVNNKSYTSKSLALKVISFDVDTVHTDQFFGPKPIMEPPFYWSDWRLSFILSVALMLIVLLWLYVYYRFKDNKPIIRIIKLAPKQPAHKVALAEINKIKSEKAWANEDSKEYYTKLTATLRVYIQERYHFSAMEMTSEEIIGKLMEVQDTSAINELRELFATADLVKFAKYNTMINENDMNLVNAIEFIDRTKEIESENTKPQPTQIKVEDKRKQRTTIFLRVFIVSSAVLALGILVWLCIEIYNLNF